MAGTGFVCWTGTVQDALGVAVQERLDAAGEADVGCDVGHPMGSLREEHVWVAGKFKVELPRRVSGGRLRSEEGPVEVHVLVSSASETMAGPRDRALRLAALVDDAVSLDPTLGGLVKEAHVATIEGEEGVTGDRQFGLTLTVEYRTTAALTGGG